MRLLRAAELDMSVSVVPQSGQFFTRKIFPSRSTRSAGTILSQELQKELFKVLIPPFCQTVPRHAPAAVPSEVAGAARVA